MIGRRVGSDVAVHDYEPGDYSKRKVRLSYDGVMFDAWWFRTPNGILGRLKMPEDRGRIADDDSPCHIVEEHRDGAITVRPHPQNSNSILAKGHTFDEGVPIEWHGYIHNGKWVRIGDPSI